MSKLLRFSRRLLPHGWWIALLNIAARLRTRFASRTGESYVWIWHRDDLFSHEACQQLLTEDLLPAFERAVHDTPRLYEVKHLLALLVITTPEAFPMRRLEFDFPFAQLDAAKERISDFLLAQTPMGLRKGSHIAFVVSNIAELALVNFPCERMAVLRTIE